MTNTAKARLHLWYGIFLSVFTVVVGVLFIVQAADIYYGGQGFSRELVMQRLAPISVPFWLWVVGVAAGGVLWIVFPPENKPVKSRPDARKTLDRLVRIAAKESEKEGFAAAAAAVRREQKVRFWVRIAALVLCLACAGVACYFLFSFPAYPSEPNKAVLRLVASVLPCVAVAFLACIGASLYDGIAAKKVLPYAKEMVKLGGKAGSGEQPVGKLTLALENPKVMLAIRLAVIVAAIVLIAVGAANGGVQDVLNKAINICTECIGLG